MSVTLNFAFITAKLFIIFLREFAVVRSIIVERNLHAYYKLPTKPAPLASISKEYHILQCPFQNISVIPTPEKMEICTIVNTYREERDNGTTSRTIKNPLHTKVKYQMPRRHKEKHKKLSKSRKTRPYMIVLKPIRMGTGRSCAYTKALRQPQSSYHTEHFGIVKKDNSRTLPVHDTISPLEHKATDQKLLETSQTNVLAKLTPITENFEENTRDNDEEASEEQKDEQDDLIVSNSNQTSDEDYSGRTGDVENEEDREAPKDSVLKYLGAKSAIEKLSKRLSNSRSVGRMLPGEQAEKFFAEHNDFQRGEKVKGFQNYYHRDEIFNDHIFYDDLQQHGHYNDRGRSLLNY
ncbi:uncharacterized protein LOC110118979 [Ceratitis capitata]|uniref:(Mediterranean fruit fly) hypothetical protein n=1 Tax=Ceratitis capitata TaxID=7213 RepID=A0A811TY34_CERCA|nr:uncharacterized protein LOC110118979 [Ceratitis capitata]CAD6991754.1 unnamed protein product [Ceratitis capitata]